MKNFCAFLFTLCIGLFSTLASVAGWLPLAGAGGGGGIPAPTFSFDFTSMSSFPASISYTRADAVATYFDNSGNLQTKALNTPRFLYDFFAKTPQGYLSEQTATNSIRNNTMQGVASGTPGIPPTNWTLNVNGNGLSTQIVGSNTQKNINYVDIRFFGTTTGTGECDIFFEATNNITATNAQKWIVSSYLQLVGGSSTNVSHIYHDIGQYNAGNTFLSFSPPSNDIATNIIPASFLRFAEIPTTNEATIAFVAPVLRLQTAGSGVAVDITLRIGMPQMEAGNSNNNGATSVIATTNAAVTRAQDFAQFVGASATLLSTGPYSVTTSLQASGANQNFAILGSATANYPGLGQLSPSFTAAANSGVSQIAISPASFFQIQKHTLGLSNGTVTRFLTADGGTVRGLSTATDSNNIGEGPFIGTGSGTGFSINSTISSINLYNSALNQAQLETVTNPVETTVWGDSLAAGTGSLSPSGNYAFVGYLGALSGQVMNRQGVGGEGSSQILTRVLADTKHTNDNIVIEAGRNDPTGPVVSDIQAMIAHFAPGNTRYVVLSIINSTAENSAASGGNLTNYNNILAMNAALVAAFPNNYLDVRSAIVAQSGGANDAPAAAAMYQGSVHPNDWGYQIMAAAIFNFAVSKNWPGYTAPPVSCSQATNFLARTSGLDATHQTAYTVMICGLVSDGIITGTMSGANSGAAACGSNLDLLYILATQNSTTAGLNLCGTSYTLTPTASPTFVADQGYTGDGSTSYNNTNFNPQIATTPNYAVNSASLGVYVRTSRAVSQGFVDFGVFSAGLSSNLLPYSVSSGNHVGVGINESDFPAAGASITNAQGFLGAVRNSSSTIDVYKNNSSTPISAGVAATSSAPAPGAKFAIGAMGGGPSNFSTDQVAAAFTGAGLTGAQWLAISTRINNYMTMVGANVY